MHEVREFFYLGAAYIIVVDRSKERIAFDGIEDKLQLSGKAFAQAGLQFLIMRSGLFYIVLGNGRR